MKINNNISSVVLFTATLYSSILDSFAKNVRENGSNCVGIKSCRPRCITFRLDRSIQDCSSSEGIFAVDSRLNPWETNRFRALNCEEANTCINDKCGEDLSGNLTVRIGEEGYSGSYFYTDVSLPEGEDLFTFCSLYPCPKQECAVPEQMGFEIQLSILRNSQQSEDISESLLVLEFYLKNSFTGPPVQTGVDNRFGPMHVEWMDDPTGCRQDFFPPYAPVSPPQNPIVETEFIELGANHYCSGEDYETRPLPGTAPPTFSPTAYPTSSPTATHEPTALPQTESPTYQLPTLSPTSTVTNTEPTSLPETSIPTITPTIVLPVTIEPTFAPSWSSASDLPSNVPTFAPSWSSETALPSSEPSVTEKKAPSLLPTTSSQPSTFDSFVPSSLPSSTPSTFPSDFLTTSSSSSPSATPTVTPTVNLTILPSHSPTSHERKANIFLRFPFLMTKMTEQSDVTIFEGIVIQYLNQNIGSDTLVHNVKVLSQSIEENILHIAELHQERRLTSGLQVEIQVTGQTLGATESFGHAVLESFDRDYQVLRSTLSDELKLNFVPPSNTDLSRNGDPSETGNNLDQSRGGGVDWGLLAASVILSIVAAVLVLCVRHVRRENRMTLEAKVTAISFPSERSDRPFGSVSDESDSGWNSIGECSDEGDGSFVGEPVPTENTEYAPDESVAPWTILGVDHTVYDDADAEECKNEETACNNTPAGALC